jgi:hypothetical protein
VRAEVVGGEVDGRLGVLRQVLDARQGDVQDADEAREARRDVDEPAGVSWRGEEGDPVALPSDALGELREREYVPEGQLLLLPLLLASIC